MSIHEECGVFGVMAEQPEDVAGLVYFGLYSLQHRGQESRFFTPAIMARISIPGII